MIRVYEPVVVACARFKSCLALQRFTFVRTFSFDQGDAIRATPWVRRYDQVGETALDETSFPHPQSFPTTYSAPT